MHVLLVGKAPEPLKNVKEHTHPYWEIVVVTEGEGWTRTAKGRWEYRAGDVYAVPPHTPHSSGSDTGFRDVYFQVDSLSFPNNTVTLAPRPEEATSLAELMFTMYLRQGRRPSLDCLGEALVQLTANRLAEEKCQPLARAIRDYLTSNCSDPEISMSRLASRFGYTDDHLRRCFKVDFGVTPLEYLLELRLRQAKRLLRMMPVWSVEEIARQCGFEDPFYFSRVFKKAEGVSPRQFRRNQG